MADPPAHPDSDDPAHPDPDPATGTPRWVKVFGIISLVVVLLVGVMLLTGGAGGHGPGRHTQDGDSGDHTPPAGVPEGHMPPGGAPPGHTPPAGGHVPPDGRDGAP